MQNSYYADLDELVLSCQSSEAKAYIAEAVSCYRAGAFRACIVSTWIAVVFDFVDKLRQLDLAGDVLAQQEITIFENLLDRNELPGLLAFEKTLLDKAKNNFELISQTEYDDLQRLFADRNRCAHPSMRTLGEPYQPTPEAARYHLRNAIVHLLQHPPVQGKAAHDRLISEIESPYFPVVHLDAIRYFSRGPLQRPRTSLVRNFVVVVLKKLFVNRPDDYVQMLRYISSIEAILFMHRNIVENTLQEKLNEIVRRVPDSELNRAVEVLYNFDTLWSYFEDDVRLKFQNYVSLMPESDIDNILWFALNISALSENAWVVVDQLELAQFRNLVRDFTRDDKEPPAKIIDKTITFYTESTSWRDANSKSTTILMPVIPFLRLEQVERLLNVMVTNSEVYGSSEMGNVLKAIKEADGKGYSGFVSLYNDLCAKADVVHGSNNRIRSLHLGGEAPIIEVPETER